MFWQRSQKDDVKDLEAALPDLPLAAPWGQHPAQKLAHESTPKFPLLPVSLSLPFFFFKAKLPRPEHACNHFHALQPALQK